MRPIIESLALGTQYCIDLIFENREYEPIIGPRRLVTTENGFEYAASYRTKAGMHGTLTVKASWNGEKLTIGTRRFEGLKVDYNQEVVPPSTHEGVIRISAIESIERTLENSTT